MISASTTGSGVDIAARLIGTELAKKLDAGVLVQSMGSPGGIEGTSWLYKVAKPDGLTLGIITEAAIDNQFWGTPVQYDATKLEYLAWWDVETAFLMVTPKKFKSVDEFLNTKGLKIGCIAPNEPWTYGAAVLIDDLKLANARIIPGYKGSSDLAMNISKGEIDGGVIGNSATGLAEKQGLTETFLQVHTQRNPIYPNVPTWLEAGKIDKPSDEKQIFDKFVTNSKLIIMPPGVPKDRVEFMSAAILDIFKDAAFVRGFQQAMVYDKPPVMVAGSQITDMVASKAKSQDRIKQAIELIQKYIAK